MVASGIGSRSSLATKVAGALLALYLIWGSTYLGIRVAIQDIPPFLMAACRWLLAGGVLLAWAHVKGARRPSWAQLRGALLLGFLMVAIGNGGVTWGETRIPSGLAALLIASVSLWMVLLDWLRPGGSLPARRVLAGVAMGLFGVVVLVDPFHGAADPAAAAAVVAAAVAWALGSMLSRRVSAGSSPAQSAGLQMLCGGVLLGAFGLVTGEGPRLAARSVGFASIAALAYLTLLGSLVGYSLYLWLMRHAAPSVVSTYACVNPAVAVFLGWALAGEDVTGRTLAATAIIVSSVGLVISSRTRGAARPMTAAPTRASLTAIISDKTAERGRTA